METLPSCGCSDHKRLSCQATLQLFQLQGKHRRTSAGFRGLVVQTVERAIPREVSDGQLCLCADPDCKLKVMVVALAGVSVTDKNHETFCESGRRLNIRFRFDQGCRKERSKLRPG